LRNLSQTADIPENAAPQDRLRLRTPAARQRKAAAAARFRN
jgi:hypothetical protein